MSMNMLPAWMPRQHGSALVTPSRHSETAPRAALSQSLQASPQQAPVVTQQPPPRSAGSARVSLTPGFDINNTSGCSRRTSFEPSRASLKSRARSPSSRPGTPGPTRSRNVTGGGSMGMWSTTRAASPRAASPGLHRYPLAQVQVVPPGSDVDSARMSVPTPSMMPECRLIQQEVKVAEYNVPPNVQCTSGEAPNVQLYEAVCDSLNAQLQAAEAREVHDEIATIKTGIASLANRIEEILDVTKDLARELADERSVRKFAVDDVQTNVEALLQQTKQNRHDLDECILRQRDNLVSERLDAEMQSVRAMLEAAMTEISTAKIEAIEKEAETLAKTRIIEARAADEETLTRLREPTNISGNRQANRNWEEEAGNIRAHIKRFQDTFSKSLSLERDSRQRDVNMLLGTIEKLPEYAMLLLDQSKQAALEPAPETTVPASFSSNTFNERLNLDSLDRTIEKLSA